MKVKKKYFPWRWKWKITEPDMNVPLGYKMHTSKYIPFILTTRFGFGSSEVTYYNYIKG
jgi:hypothetical protein